MQSDRYNYINSQLYIPTYKGQLDHFCLFYIDCNVCILGGNDRPYIPRGVILSDGDDQIEPKVKTQLQANPQKIPGTKNNPDFVALKSSWKW